MGVEVTDIDSVVTDLHPGRSRQPPKQGQRERGAFFRDSEGNLLGIGQATR
jgi:hypothetical protein